MALTDEHSKELENLFRTELQKQYLRGLRAGVKTASTVCLEKLNDNSKPLLNRIKDAKKYCSVALQPDFLTKGIDETPANINIENSESNEHIEVLSSAENDE